MSARCNYAEMLEGVSGVPLFFQPRWLNMTCGNNWGGVVVNVGNLVAALPYAKVKVGFITKLGQPKLTPFLGPIFVSNGERITPSLSDQHKLLAKLIEQLPGFSVYKQNWPSWVSNWLPFHWEGYQQTTRYTYKIYDISDSEQVWAGLASSARREVRKARNRYKLEVVENCNIDDFVQMNAAVFERNNRTPPYSAYYLKSLIEECIKMDMGRLLVARDQKEHCHAGVFVVWDREFTYYLVGGSNSENRNSGAMTLCLWEAICRGQGISIGFDFEGSMLSNVEKYFRTFGAKQVPYFSVSKNRSAVLRLIEAFR